jgi:hypothetical protein
MDSCVNMLFLKLKGLFEGFGLVALWGIEPKVDG